MDIPKYKSIDIDLLIPYARTKQANLSDQLERGGVTPTCTLQKALIIREC